MEWKFFCTLFLCGYIASYYKNITSPQAKKFYGTCIGLIVILVLSDGHLAHPMLITIINSFIILQGDKRTMHIYCFGFSWTYLFLIHCGVVNIPWQTVPIYMIITLRLVGLSFEVNASYLSKNRSEMNHEEYKVDENIMRKIASSEELNQDPNMEDIMSYTFNFIGIHRGPYYKWKTFNDYLELPFTNVEITKMKFPNNINFFPVYFWLELLRSLKNYLSDNGSDNNVGVFWYWSSIPQIVLLLLYHNLISANCESVCIDAGFGIYPEKCKAIPGAGPTDNINLLRQIKDSPELAVNETYDFNTIKNSDEYKMFMGPTMRQSLRNHNMTIQYWFWACVYRRLPIRSKTLRTTLTMFSWYLWSGIKFGNLIMVLTLLLYLYVEDLYQYIFQDIFTGRIEKTVYDGIHLVLRSLCFIYLAPTQYFPDYARIIRFYNSTYWSLHLLLILLLMAGLIMKRKRKRIQETTAIEN